jgi:hypothetical protein
MMICMLSAISCATQGTPQGSWPRGLERSVFPVYVIDDGSVRESFDGRRRTATARYAACAGVYVAPDIVATSSTALPFPGEATSYANAGSVTILDGDRSIDVTEVLHFDHLTGVALLRVSERRQPLRLRADDLPPRAPLRFLGYRFSPPAIKGRLADAEWSSGEAEFRGSTTGYGALHYEASVSATPGSCGSVVLDAAGVVVGLLHGGSGRRVILIPASAIRTALGEVAP